MAQPPLDREFGALQEQVREHAEHLSALDERVDTHYDDLKAQLTRIEKEATKQNGFIAGMVFLATCIGVVLGVFKDFLIDRLLK